MAHPLWITYAWEDNKESDFDYLVRELETAGVAATFDRYALVPGQRLWEQIGDKIKNDNLSGWAYLLTPQSVTRPACKEELAYAINRALSIKEEGFPLIGLLHGISFDDVPLSLKVRLCVSLKNPNWREEVKAGVELRAPTLPTKTLSKFHVIVHENYGNVPGVTALEVRPRFEETHIWRFAYPTNGPKPVEWGFGGAKGGGVNLTKNGYMSGATITNTNGQQFDVVGCSNPISPSTSAYLVFNGPLPTPIFFAPADHFGSDLVTLNWLEMNNF